MNTKAAKKCLGCLDTKPLGEFYRHKKFRDGRSSQCKKCDAKKHSERYWKNKGIVKERTKEWLEYESTKRTCVGCRVTKPSGEFYKDKSRRGGLREKCKACMKPVINAYEEKNRSKIKESRALRYARNIEGRRASSRRWYLENRRHAIAWQLAYEAKNKDKVRAAKKRRKAERMRADPCFRARMLVSSSVRNALKPGRKGGGKTFDALPYTPQELKDHLISTMPDGYTEQDWLDGKLHIDHIVPHSAFPYTSMDCELFRMCWALENLRLIPASQNIRKSNLIEHKTKSGVVYYKCIFAPSRKKDARNENMCSMRHREKEHLLPEGHHHRQHPVQFMSQEGAHGIPRQEPGED